MQICEDCKKHFNQQEQADYILTLNSLPKEEMHLCEYHAMILIQDLAKHRANFKLKSLIDGTVYRPVYRELGVEKDG